MQSQMSAAISGKLSFGVVGLIGPLVVGLPASRSGSAHALGLIFARRGPACGRAASSGP
jgi:hypothetical protein